MPDNNVILVAEDDPHDAFLLQRAFVKARVLQSLRFVTDGQQAIDYLRGTPPFHDRARSPFPILFVLDLKLPRLSGLDVLTWLSRQPELHRLRTVVLSASQDPDQIERAYAYGADYCMRKPSGKEQLVDAVRHLKRHWLDMSSAAVIPEQSFSRSLLAARL
jgi:CheY-like chemotaxis protein